MFRTKFINLNQKLYPGHLYYSPDWLVLGVNNACNLHCKMCDVGTGYSGSNFSHHLLDARPVNMPLNLFRKICGELRCYFPDTKLGYAFTEPLIYPHLLESLAIAQKENLFTALTTNGLKLVELAPELAVSGLNCLMVSIDGPPATHNSIRGNTRAFESAFNGIIKLLALSRGRIKVSVYFTITEWNFDKLTEFISFFRKIPLERIGFMHPNYVNRSMTQIHNHRWGDRYTATESNLAGMNLENIVLPVLMEQIHQIRNRLHAFPVSFSPDLNSLEELVNYYNHPEILIGKRCNDAFRIMMIKSNGEVIPSHGRCYNIVAGNIFENNLKQIWNSETLVQFRKNLLKSGGLFPACARCCSAF